MSIISDGKQCSKCDEIKPLAEFYKDKYTPDGLCRRCKECQRQHDQARKLQPKVHIEVDPTLPRRCAACGKDRPLSAFWRNARTATGYAERCKECVRAYYEDYIEPPHIVVQDGIEGKVCSGCKAWKPTDGFYRSGKNADGFCDRCQECDRQRGAATRAKNRARNAAAIIDPDRDGRVCANCNEWKPFRYFVRSASTTTGFDCYCKSCKAHMIEARYNTLTIDENYHKRCRVCGEWKHCLEYHVSKGTGDGLRGECKQCFNESQKATHIRARKARLGRSRYHADPDRHRAYARDWRWRNIDRVRLREREVANRRGRLKRTAGKVDYEAAWDRAGSVCYICNLPFGESKIHFDHIVPISKGGPHTLGNITPTHSHCNLYKHDKLPTVYPEWFDRSLIPIE